jgi:hypothetical protein
MCNLPDKAIHFKPWASNEEGHDVFQPFPKKTACGKDDARIRCTHVLVKVTCRTCQNSRLFKLYKRNPQVKKETRK